MLTFTQTSALIKAIQAAFEYEIGTKLEVQFWTCPDDVPLPPFSPKLIPMLQNPQPLDKPTRFRMAEIAASFYFQYCNEHLRHPSAYQHVGKRVMAAYPALMAEGAHPWSSFVKAVSDKVRTKRFHAKHAFSTGEQGEFSNPGSSLADCTWQY